MEFYSDFSVGKKGGNSIFQKYSDNADEGGLLIDPRKARMIFARLDLQQQGEMLQLQLGKAKKSSNAQMFGGLLACGLGAGVGFLTFKIDGLVFLGSCFVSGLGLLGIIFKNEPIKKFKREWMNEINRYQQAMTARVQARQQPMPQNNQSQKSQNHVLQNQLQVRPAPQQVQIRPSNQSVPNQLQSPRPLPPRPSQPITDGQGAFKLDLGFMDDDEK